MRAQMQAFQHLFRCFPYPMYPLVFRKFLVFKRICLFGVEVTTHGDFGI